MTIHYDDKGKFFTDVVTKEQIPVTIQTLTHRIHGTIHILPRDRLMDALNKCEQFVPITEAVVFNTRGEPIYRAAFISIQRDHIVWVLPDHEITSPENNPGEAS